MNSSKLLRLCRQRRNKLSTEFKSEGMVGLQQTALLWSNNQILWRLKGCRASHGKFMLESEIFMAAKSLSKHVSIAVNCGKQMKLTPAEVIDAYAISD